MAAFKLDQIQADAILEIRLYQLARLEIEKIREERAAKKARLKEIEALLARPKERWKLIRKELVDLGEKYGDARRTTISAGDELAYDPEAYIVHEDAVVVVSRDGWIKRLQQVKDPSSTRLREGDALFAVLPGTTRDRLALFSTQGTVYVMRVADVPATTGYGEPVQSLFKFGDGERVVAARLLREPDAPPTGAQTGLPGIGPDAGEAAWTPAVLVATARGFGFRAAPDLTETTRSGRRFARVADGDEIVTVEPIFGPSVVTATTRGKMLRFPLEEVAELSGPGRGVILMRPEKDGDAKIVGALALPKDGAFFAVTPEGNERKFALGDVPAGKRGGKGQRVVKRGGVRALKRVEAEK
jgi:DNA gyrase subunit A